jgi:hypothetical protein
MREAMLGGVITSLPRDVFGVVIIGDVAEGGVI